MVTKNEIITDGTVKWKVKKFSSEDGNPIGTIIMYSANTLPDGYLICDGSAISRTDYSDLFSVIGTTWGSGDGSTTFNLPNAVNRFPEGSSTAGGYVAAGLPNITGQFVYNRSSYNYYEMIPGGYSYSVPSVGALYPEFAGNNPPSANLTAVNGNSGYYDIMGFNFDASKSNAIYGKSTTNQPAAFNVKYLIKYTD